jgi:thymidylate synthase (FAD)
MFVPSEVKDTAEQMYELARKKAPHLLEKTAGKQEVLDWFPSSQLFAQKNEGLEWIITEMGSDEVGLLDEGNFHLDEKYIKKAVESRDEAELANLKHYHFTFLAPMSLATFHQATRQRTWNQSVQPLTSAVSIGNYVVPPTVKGTRFEEDFKSLIEESITFVSQNISDVNSFGVLPHALSVYDLIHINGWNGVYSVGKRTCKTAQWEIRGIAKSMAEEIRNVAPELGKYSVPQGILYGSCPERNNCGRCGKR